MKKNLYNLNHLDFENIIGESFWNKDDFNNEYVVTGCIEIGDDIHFTLICPVYGTVKSAVVYASMGCCPLNSKDWFITRQEAIRANINDLQSTIETRQEIRETELVSPKESVLNKIYKEK